ncbi:hypothetical protein QUF54_06850 [Candidatus Marithioploca araucensis]|uniref:Uncharacterized protein n=1 Tax=Candidatus Marithioploca araucensis TaxID=70273 RepID=A0ABT7VU30_9GAMM|nr:hypothetical protein [Candidatus Marithioploca araucensis]
MDYQLNTPEWQGFNSFIHVIRCTPDRKIDIKHPENGNAPSWACSAGYDLRFVFEFVQHEGAEAILLEDIGTMMFIEAEVLKFALFVH